MQKNDISQIFKHQGTVWLVTDALDINPPRARSLPPLSKPLAACTKCSGRFSYKSDIDASDHLLQDHFPPDNQHSRAIAKHWVKEFQPLSDGRCCEQHLNILTIANDHLKDIYKSVQEICDGVRAVGEGHNPRYRLPKALVVAFRKLLLFLVYTTSTIHFVTNHRKSWTSSSWTMNDDKELTKKITKIKRLGFSVEEAVDIGKLDLTMMLRIEDYTGSVKRHKSVGLYYTMIMALGNVQFGVYCQDIVEVYKEYIARLVSTHSLQLCI